MQPEQSSQPPAQPVYVTNPVATPTEPVKQRKRLLIGGLIVAAVLLIGSSVGAYFGIVVPNQPENVWKSGLENTADGYDRLTTYTSDRQGSKGGVVRGNFKLDTAGTVIDGNIDTKYYEKNSQTKLDVGLVGTRFNLELLTIVPPNTKNPDVYAKITGLKGLDQLLGTSGAAAGQSFASLDDQWLVVDHTLLDQLEKEAINSADNPTSMPTLTSEDITAIAQTIGKVNRQYLFTQDQSKAVFTVAQNVGKEKLDDRDVYHYKVGYNKDHLKAYATALKNELKNTKLKDYITDKQFEEMIIQIDQMDANRQADVWVDLKTKLLRQIRFNQKDKPDNYVDLKLNYNGGDELPFVINVVGKDNESQGTAQFGVSLNMKTNVLRFNTNIKGTQAGQPLVLTVDATLTPGNDVVTPTKPQNAKPLLEAYSQLFGQPAPTAQSLRPTTKPVPADGSGL